MNRPRTRLLTRLALVAVAVVLVAAGVAMLRSSDDASELDMEGNPVALAPGAAPSADQLERMDAQPDVGLRFQVPAVDLDVPLGASDMVDNTINPPGFTSAYQIRNLGVPVDEAATGTVFVAMHSLRGGVGPGNHLINVAAQQSKLDPGTEVAIGDRSWIVTGDLTVSKFDLGEQEHLFNNTAGRLVIITCQQRRDGTATTQNLVITAQLAD